MGLQYGTNVSIELDNDFRRCRAASGLRRRAGGVREHDKGQPGRKDSCESPPGSKLEDIAKPY